MKRATKITLICAAAAAVLLLLIYGSVRFSFRRPYAETVKAGGVEPALVYAVMRAESGFDEKAVSRAGAVGLMQLRPSTARFIGERSGIAFEPDRLSEGEYNVRLGCAYLSYLLERFPVRETALAAYNAGEGTVREWLSDGKFSADGQRLDRIPYGETARYIKKVDRFRKIYLILYG